LVCFVSGCAKNKFALKIGDRVITAEQYKAVAVSIKSQFLTDNGLEDTDDLWTRPISTNDSTTAQQYLDAMIQSYLIEYNLYAIHFDELGLEIPADTLREIDDEVSALEKQYGGKEGLDKALREQGFSYDEYKNQFYNEVKKQQVILHYFGPDSEVNPTDRDEMRKYYNEYYTKVKHIFLSTKDSDTNDFSVEEKKKVGETAQRIYDRIKAGEDYDKLLEEFNQDSGMTSNPDGYIFSVDEDNTTFPKAFSNAAFEMEFGEVRIVQTNMGYHIMKRYEFMTEEVTDRDVEVTLIENMMSSEVSEILDGLKERIGVTYNNTVLTNLSSPNIKVKVPTEETTDPTDALKDAFAEETEE
jgi:foldase protein PrsA